MTMRPLTLWDTKNRAAYDRSADTNRDTNPARRKQPANGPRHRNVTTPARLFGRELRCQSAQTSKNLTPPDWSKVLSQKSS